MDAAPGVDGAAGGALLRLSQGSFDTAIRRRGAVNRVLGMDLDGFFTRICLAFFKADRAGEIVLSERHRVLDIAGEGRARGIGAGFRAEGACLRRLRRIVAEDGVVLLHANDPYLSGLNALLLSLRTRVPFVVEVLSDYDLSYRVGRKRTMPYLPARWCEKWVEWLVLRLAAGVYADRDYYLRYARANGARPGRSGRVRCVTDPFYYEANSSRCVDDYLPASGRDILLFVGRLSAEKYPLDCVEVLHSVRLAGRDAVLVLVGEGDLRDDVADRARSLGLAEQVYLLGSRPPQEVFDLLSGASVVLATHSGYSLLEAALSGTPIVAYDFEWHPEFIRPGVTGVLVPYRDAAAMARAVVELLQQPESGEALARAARNRALREHRPEDQRSDERAFYREVLRWA